MPKRNAIRTPNHIKDLVLLLSIPAALAAIGACFAILPGILANPQYDFIYSHCKEYQCDTEYKINPDTVKVIEARTIKDQFSSPTDPSYSATLNYYNIKTGSSTPISLERAQAYNLDISSRSPDGYSLQYDEGNGGFFSDGYQPKWYLKNGNRKQSVEFSKNYNNYSENINFLGWVKK